TINWLGFYPSYETVLAQVVLAFLWPPFKLKQQPPTFIK
ncbi:hypothetical protein SS7213T_05186, partial [Staphylococcus simiae CCM 7213 = CCUG 51256]